MNKLLYGTTLLYESQYFLMLCSTVSPAAHLRPVTFKLRQFINKLFIQVNMRMMHAKCNKAILHNVYTRRGEH